MRNARLAERQGTTEASIRAIVSAKMLANRTNTERTAAAQLLRRNVSESEDALNVAVERIRGEIFKGEEAAGTEPLSLVSVVARRRAAARSA